MALLLEKKLYDDTVVYYHRIREFQIDPVMCMVTINLESFESREQRASLVMPLDVNVFSFPWSGKTETLHKEAYDYVKTQNAWTDAVDH